MRILKSYFLGKSISYKDGMLIMKESIKDVYYNYNKNEGKILFLEYKDTITITNKYNEKNLLVNKEILKKKILN